MARLAFILLCHQDAASVIRQARLLTSQGDALAIHVDARAKPGVYQTVRDSLADNPNVVLARRVKCGWGEWSLVQATLNTIEAALARFPFTTHFYLVSGDCMPVKSAAFIHRFLDDNDLDFIENKDFLTSGWIKTGLQIERLTYRHWINERKHKRAFYASLWLQKKLGLRRDPPAGLQMMIGSQWWCLRRGTIEKIMAFVKKRPDVVRFFHTTWVPDETFFQTLVAHLVPRTAVQSRPPTFLKFSDYGMPATFHGDHFEFLKSQRELFARKVSAYAQSLHQNLSDLFAESQDTAPMTDNGIGQFEFATLQGRHGTRFAPRFWEVGMTIGASRLVHVYVCKKWHIAQRLATMIHDAGGPACYGYVFDGDRPNLPSMGGYEYSRGKRLQHRRAFLNILATQEKVSTLAICVDTSNVAALIDLNQDDCILHVLQIDCSFDDAYLIGHADRIGLGGSLLSTEAQADLATTLRRVFADERLAVRKLGLPAMFRIQNGDSFEDTAETLAGFSGIHVERALRIARDPALFE